MTKAADDRDSVVARLNVLIALSMRGTDGKPLPTAQQVRILTELGVGAPEVADILGKSLNHIHSILSKSRR